MRKHGPVLHYVGPGYILNGSIAEIDLADLPNGVDDYTKSVVRFIQKVKQTEGGEKMAKSISVNEILKQAQAAQDAYDAAVEQRKAVRRVARTLAEAGLLDDDDVAKVEEIFPARKSKTEEDEVAAE